MITSQELFYLLINYLTVQDDKFKDQNSQLLKDLDIHISMLIYYSRYIITIKKINLIFNIEIMPLED